MSHKSKSITSKEKQSLIKGLESKKSLSQQISFLKRSGYSEKQLRRAGLIPKDDPAFKDMFRKEQKAEPKAKDTSRRTITKDLDKFSGPKYTPAGGKGTQVTSGGILYEFTGTGPTGWLAVATARPPTPPKPKAPPPMTPVKAPMTPAPPPPKPKPKVAPSGPMTTPEGKEVIVTPEGKIIAEIKREEKKVPTIFPKKEAVVKQGKVVAYKDVPGQFEEFTQEVVTSVPVQRLAPPTKQKKKKEIVTLFDYRTPGQRFADVITPKTIGERVLGKIEDPRAPALELVAVKQVVAKGGFPGRVVSQFLPETKAGLGLAVAIPYGFAKAPVIVRGVAQAGFTGYAGVKIADPDLSLEQKTGLGLLAGIGLVGGVRDVGLIAKRGIIPSRVKPKISSLVEIKPTLAGKIQEYKIASSVKVGREKSYPIFTEGKMGAIAEKGIGKDISLGVAKSIVKPKTGLREYYDVGGIVRKKGKVTSVEVSTIAPPTLQSQPTIKIGKDLGVAYTGVSKARLSGKVQIKQDLIAPDPRVRTKVDIRTIEGQAFREQVGTIVTPTGKKGLFTFEQAIGPEIKTYQTILTGKSKIKGIIQVQPISSQGGTAVGGSIKTLTTPKVKLEPVVKALGSISTIAEQRAKTSFAKTTGITQKIATPVGVSIPSITAPITTAKTKGLPTIQQPRLTSSQKFGLVSQPRLASIQIQQPRVGITQPGVLGSIQQPALRSIQQPKLGEGLISQPRLVQQPKAGERLISSPRLVQQPRIIQQPKARERLISRPRIIQQPRVIRGPPTISFPRTPIRTTTTFPGLTFPGRARPRRVRKATFGVSIKTAGKFRSVAGGLSLGKAISLGAGITGRGPATTFKITPQKGGLVSGGIGIPKGFKKKKKGLIFVEEGTSTSKGIKTGAIKI